MRDILKFHHNCYAYRGIRKERKSTFLTGFEHWEKGLAACLLHNIFIAIVSESLCYLRAQCTAQLQDICYIFTTHVSVMGLLCLLHSALMTYKQFYCS